MGGNSIEDDWDLTNLSNNARTVVLVGRTGNGKSATGNSILGRKAFKSRASSNGITSTSELQCTMLKDGQSINVIDTPGLFDYSEGAGLIGKEIVKCIELAKDGVHAVLLVFSVRTRFSLEEEAALTSLQTFFGPKITDYMIVVFTGGDELEDDEETIDDYLGRDCPEPLQKLLVTCKRRYVLFDNKTKSERKKAEQLKSLMNLVDKVVEVNGGRPFTDDVFTELKKGATILRHQEKEVASLQGYSQEELKELKGPLHRTYADLLKRITEMVEAKLKDTTNRLEQKLAEEQAARLKAEKSAQAERERSNAEIRKLRETLEKANRENEHLKNKQNCLIL